MYPRKWRFWNSKTSYIFIRNLVKSLENTWKVVCKNSHGILMIIKKMFSWSMLYTRESNLNLDYVSKCPVSNANCQTEDQANSSQQNQYTCSSCSSRTFSTCKNLNQHNRHCTNHFNVVSISSSQPVTISERTEVTNVFSPAA